MTAASGGWEQVVATEKKEKPNRQEKVLATWLLISCTNVGYPTDMN